MNNAPSEKEIRRNIPFRITVKRKYLGIYLIKEEKDAFNENFEILKRKAVKIRGGKDSP